MMVKFEMFKRPRGTRDFGPDEMIERRWAEESMRDVSWRYGFREIQMPTFEEVGLFTTKSGPTIVDELYAFKDKSGRDIALRPEMTAQAVRFYINDLTSMPKPLKLFYFGPCFRYENPQSGRYREFFQFGAEIIGANTPETDAETISLAASLIDSLGLKDYIVRIGHIGILRKMLKESGLSDEDITEGLHHIDKEDEGLLRRFVSEKGISKEIMERIDSVRGLRGDFDVLEQLDEGESKSYLMELIECLGSLGLDNGQLDLGMVRGLDYYTGVVFEIDAPSLGAEKQICGGGSYDLVSLFGGDQAFSTGFAIGFDRVLLALEREGKKALEACLDAYIVPMGDDARKKAMEIANTLRKGGLSVDFDLMRRSLSKNLKYAASLKARKAIIIGKKELAGKNVTIRDMTSGEQIEVPSDSIFDAMKKDNS